MSFWAAGGAVIGGLLSYAGARKQAAAQRAAAEAAGRGTAPWAGQVPYLLDLFSNAQNLYRQNKSLVAPWTASQQLGNAGTVGSALQVANVVNPQALSAWSRLASPAMLDVANNPYVMGGAKGIADTVTQKLMEQVLPRIDMSAVKAGQYGSSRQALAQGQAIGQTNRALSQTLADYLAQAYDKGLTAQQRAVAMTPGIGQSMIAPWQTIFTAGQQEQQQQERQLRDPWERLQLYQNLVGGRQYGGQKPYISPTTYSPVASGFGGALQGMALGGQLGSLFGGGDKISKTSSAFNTLGKLGG